jgi:hypothetical protein
MTEREGFEPSNEVTPVTRFPVAPVQPLRHLSRGRPEGYDTDASTVGRLPPVLPTVLALSKAATKDIGLIVTFIGIGVIVNVVVVFILVQVRGEHAQNREQLDP